MNLDIFNNDAFGLSQLTLAMQDMQHTPTLLGDLGLFNEQGISTTSVMIEKIGQSFTLVAAAERGSPGAPVGNQKRTLKSFSTVHLPQRGAVNADEVLGVRAFGTETELQTVQGIVNAKLQKLRRNIDLTFEWQRMGALKGQVLDADGATVLLDLFNEFGVVQNTLSFALGVDTTKVKQKCLDLERMIEDELDGIVSSGTQVLCSKEFFDALVQHPAVEKAFEFYNSQMKSESQRKTGFEFGNVTFREYRGKVGGLRFIAAGEAYAVPVGIPDLFIARFAPADYVETVNTVGLPYYAKQWMEQPNKRVELEAQSNPLFMNTRPRTVVKLTIA
jgi:hypothetical protein